MMTSCSNTLALLSDGALRYSARDLATLTNLSIPDMNCLNTISIQELCQSLAQLVDLTQHLLTNPYFMATTMVVNSDTSNNNNVLRNEPPDILLETLLHNMRLRSISYKPET
jgi:hypothetical protein